VSTTIGIEGLGIEAGTTALVADTPDQFARAVESVLTDETLWTSLSTHGESHARESHGPVRTQAALRSAIDRIMSASPTAGAR
jgi:hypothetical protein